MVTFILILLAIIVFLAIKIETDKFLREANEAYTNSLEEDIEFYRKFIDNE